MERQRLERSFEGWLYLLGRVILFYEVLFPILKVFAVKDEALSISSTSIVKPHEVIYG